MVSFLARRNDVSLSDPTTSGADSSSYGGMNMNLTLTNSTGMPPIHPYVAMLAASGKTPNYIDPPSLAPVIFGVGISFSILSMIFMIGRMWSRHYLLRRVGFEDHLIVFSWFQSVFLVFCCCWSTRYGVGLHWWDIRPEVYQKVPSFPAQYVTTLIYPTVITCIKFSILIFYHRLTPSVTFNRIVKATMLLTILIFLGTFFANLFQCIPLRLAWDMAAVERGEGSCINVFHLWISGAALHVLTDIIIFILPIPLILTSQLPIKQKLHAMVIFALGLLLVIASVVRLQMNIITLDPEQIIDYNWSGSNAMAWTTMEVNVGIIVACLPGIRPLLAHYLPRWFATPETPTPSQPPTTIEVIMPNGDTEYMATVSAEAVDYDGTTEKRKRGSFLDALWDGKGGVVKMQIRKSASGRHLKGVRSVDRADSLGGEKEEV